MRKSILMTLLCAASSCATGQMVLQADSAQLQPQVGRDEEGFKSCGVRAVVVLATKDYFDAYDFSLMVRYDIPYGTLKAGKIRTSVKKAKAGQYSTEAVIPAPIKFWLVKEDEGKALTSIKTMPAETKGYILEIAGLGDTLRGILSMIHGERMQFAIRYKVEPVDAVVAFAAKMPDHERIPLMKCLDGVGDRLAKTATQLKE